MTDGADPNVPIAPLPVGSSAPDFALRDQNNQLVSLRDILTTRRALVVFFPLAFTGTCEGELGYIRDHLPQFASDDLQTVAVSVGPPPTHKVWSSAQGFLFPVLADFWPHGEVARSYGVFNDRNGYANRGTFLVDRDGTILFSDMVGPGESREHALWEKALLALP
ncbi:redoxin domain-containing protein [Gordonia soli]|uniref:Alkyl hydroperoxide reductase E n=1 Tax=Gordonia soli NBRC 108243 TaxID=1223545 RepID=M0QM05_9ACTN|nr:redoxin domain-containing protein [Gordonia soli]GAC69439.1 peroxiredoxin AhpE [Gordonia soli NBRC 108243]